MTKPRSKGKPPSRPSDLSEPTGPKIYQLYRSALVLNILVGMVRVMQGISYVWTLALAYLFFVLATLEIWYEPKLKFHALVKICLTVILVILAVWFTKSVTFATAPIGLSANVLPGGYEDGQKIGSIEWDSHFTDMRVSVDNESIDQYVDVDMILLPDNWTHQASIVSSDTCGCSVTAVPGRVINTATARKSGKVTPTINQSLDMYDDMGNLYKTIATGNGYRLRCEHFARKCTVEVAFALVTITKDKLAFGTSPLPVRVNITGIYKRGIKPYSLRNVYLDVH